MHVSLSFGPCAAQLGALDILQAPISEQSDRLLFHTEKWKHTLPRKSKDAKELSSGQASDCFSLDIPVPRTEVLSQLVRHFHLASVYTSCKWHDTRTMLPPVLQSN